MSVDCFSVFHPKKIEKQNPPKNLPCKKGRFSNSAKDQVSKIMEKAAEEYTK